MPLWFVEMDFQARTGSAVVPYYIRYHVYMTESEADRLRATLRSMIEKSHVLPEPDLVGFDIEPVDDLTFTLREFAEDMEENHPRLFEKMRKRWAP